MKAPLTDEQRRARIDEVLRSEKRDPLAWWWLSFADPRLPEGQQFLGVAVVRARGVASAMVEAHRMGLNPGGEISTTRLDDAHLPPEADRERLLTRAEAEAAIARMGG